MSNKKLRLDMRYDKMKTGEIAHISKFGNMMAYKISKHEVIIYDGNEMDNYIIDNQDDPRWVEDYRQALIEMENL